MARIGPVEVRERYGVDPRQVPDFIALRGDPSNKLPGSRGVGASCTG
jgi:DNA polymerase I